MRQKLDETLSPHRRHAQHGDHPTVRLERIARMTEHNLFILLLRVLHERTGFAAESGGAVNRQAGHPRSGRREPGYHRGGSPLMRGGQAVMERWHLADGEAGECSGKVRLLYTLTDQRGNKVRSIEG